MTRYTSGDKLNLKIGIESYSENLTSLEVIGTAEIDGDINVSAGNSITAPEYYGDGSNLTGITLDQVSDAIGGITVQEEGVDVGTTNGITNINLVSSNLTATGSGIGVTITLTDTPTFATITGDLTGTATTATQLETSRNFSVSGDVATASNVSFDGTADIDLAVTLSNNFSTNTSGIISAFKFSGDGSELTNLTPGQVGALAGVTIREEGTLEGSSVGDINFVSSNLTATASGVGATITLTDTPTFSTITGDLTGTATTATKLETSRNFSVSGDVATALAVPFDGTGDVDLAVTLSNDFSANTTGIITASEFHGNGENLTGITLNQVSDAIGGITVQEEGVDVGTTNGITNINFTSDNLTATASGIGATITLTDTPTFSTITGDLTGTATTATKLETSRNFNVSGDVATALAVPFDGTGDVDLAVTLSNDFSANTSGIITAFKFSGGDINVSAGNSITAPKYYGDGSNLTGLSAGQVGALAGVTIREEGTLEGSSVGDINFVSSNLTATASGIGATITLTDTPTFSTITGDLTGTATTATKLETSRNFSVSGDVATASNVSFDGTGDVDLAVTLSNDFSANTSGIITASKFSGGDINVSAGNSITAPKYYGDGSNLTNLTPGQVGALAGVTIREEDSVVGSEGAVGDINFVGNYITATASGAGATITLSDITLGTDTIGNYVATISGTANEIEVTNGSSAGSNPTIGLPNNVTISNDLSVSGNLNVTGTLTYEDVTNVDSIGIVTARSGIDAEGDINVSAGNSITAPKYYGDGSGLTGLTPGQVGALAGVTIREEGTLEGSAGSVGDINFVSSNLTATASGIGATITLTDTPSFTTISGDLTGTATTATQLETSRNFSVSGVVSTTSAVSFDGTANVDLAVTLSNDFSANTTGIITAFKFSGDGSELINLTPGQVGALAGVTIREEGTLEGSEGSVGDINFVSSNLTATASGVGATITLTDTPTFSTITGDLTGTATTATNADNIEVDNDSSATFKNVVFVNGTNGNLKPQVNTSIQVQPSTGILTASKFHGDGSNLTGLSATQVGAMAELVSDTSPQLGGDLDLNGFDIKETGNINITGVVTATSFDGDITGTATTATKLETSRNFSVSGVVSTTSAVSFDGTANVDLEVTLSNDFSANTSGIITAFKFSGNGSSLTGLSATQVGAMSSLVNDTTPQLGGDLDLNGFDITETGNINITGVITATSLSGDGSGVTGVITATNADNIEVDNDSSATFKNVVFVNGTNGNLKPQVNTSIQVQPSTGILTALQLHGDGSNLTGLTPGQVGAMAELVSDTTPELGGDLDLNNFDITGDGNININGSITATSFVGTASTATTVTISSNNDSTAYRVPYTSSTSGDVSLYVDNNDGMTYNPGTNTLFAGSFSGNGSNLTSVDADTLDTLNSTQFLRSDIASEITAPLTIDSDNNVDGALRIENNVSNTNNDFYFAQEIIQTLSGSQVATADLEQGGIYMDINSTNTGGDTSNEHRAYGIYIDLDSTGDANVVNGIYVNATATPTTGTTSNVWAGYFFAEDNGGAGAVTNIFGVQAFAYSDNADSDTNNQYGGYFKSYCAADSAAVGVAYGVYSEIEINGTTDLYGPCYAFLAEIDNNTDVAQTNTSYLLYGNYSGTLPTTAYGVYINNNVPSYFGGGIEIPNGPGTIAGGTFANGWLRIGTSSAGITMDSNEFYFAGAGNIGALSGGSITFTTRPAFNGGTSGSSSPFTVDSTELVTNLNADLLDGQEGTYYLNYANFTGTPTIPTNNNELTNGAGYITSSGSITGTATTATKLETSRNFSVSGDVATASNVSFDGTANVDLAVTLSNDFSANTTGIITASEFHGNGENLTGITLDQVSDAIGGITIREEGTLEGSEGSVGDINFVGNYITATASGVGATITLSDITLGTDTTGNYVATISGTANEIQITNGTGAGSTPTIGLPNNVTISNDLSVSGNLNVTGTLTYEDVTNVDSIGIVTARSGIDAEGDINVSAGNSITAPEYYGDGSGLTGLSAGQVGAMTDLVSDTSPQLGGDLDLNNFDIIGNGNINITGVITATSKVHIGSNENTDIALQADGNVRVGFSTTSNYIAFHGTWWDGTSSPGVQQVASRVPYTHTYVGERIYNYPEDSELLLYKGNDNHSQFGTDRIRYLSGMHEFQLINDDDTVGTFEEVGNFAGITTALLIDGIGETGVSTVTVFGDFVVNGDFESDINVSAGNSITAPEYYGDGSGLTGLSAGQVGAMTDLVSDIDPELGGDLDLNNFDIIGNGNINITGVITATSFDGDITGNADTTTNVGVTNESSDTVTYVTFVRNNTANNLPILRNDNLTFNANNGTLSATTFNGNATTATDSTNCSRSVVAGNGLTGGGTLNANRTLNVGAGDGISVAADTVAVDTTVIRTTGNQSIGGTKTFSNTIVGSINGSAASATDSTNCSRSVVAGNGLTGGGTLNADRTLNVGAGDGISVAADTVAVDATVVRTTGNQSISGVKTFNNDIISTRIDADGTINTTSGGAVRAFLANQDITFTGSTNSNNVYPNAFKSTPRISATSSIGNFAHFHAQNLNISAGGSVTINRAFDANSNLTDTATNNYAFVGRLNTGSNTNWNFYADGTAPNYFEGDVQTNKLLVGTSNAPTGATSGTLVVEDSIQMFNSGAQDNNGRFQIYVGEQESITATTGLIQFTFSTNPTTTRTSALLKITVSWQNNNNNILNQPTIEFMAQINNDTSGVVAVSDIEPIFEWRTTVASDVTFTNLNGGQCRFDVKNTLNATPSATYKVEVLCRDGRIDLSSVSKT